MEETISFFRVIAYDLKQIQKLWKKTFNLGFDKKTTAFWVFLRVVFKLNLKF